MGNAYNVRQALIYQQMEIVYRQSVLILKLIHQIFALYVVHRVLLVQIFQMRAHHALIVLFIYSLIFVWRIVQSEPSQIG
jgi:hypothetical protein